MHEFRQDYQNAIKHYEDAYKELVILLNSEYSDEPVDKVKRGSLPGLNTSLGSLLIGTVISPNTFLPPFSKRWKEAKELADFIFYKVLYPYCQLYRIF